MRRLILSSAYIMIIVFTATAQNERTAPEKFCFSVAGTGAFTLDYISAFSLLTYGGDVQAEYSIEPKLAVTLSAGYLALSVRSIFGTDVTLPSFVPVLLGGRYYFRAKIYGSLQAGTSFIIPAAASNFPLDAGKGNEFTYVPGIGYKFSKHIDLLFKYQSSTKYVPSAKQNINFSFAGLRIAYVF
jgi:hypothetical protein